VLFKKIASVLFYLKNTQGGPKKRGHILTTATLPCNLSLRACFADINVLQGSAATYARCGGICNIHLTANLQRNLQWIRQNYAHETVAPLFGPPCIYILALEMASPGNGQCANCIGTLSFCIGVCIHVPARSTVCGESRLRSRWLSPFPASLLHSNTDTLQTPPPAPLAQWTSGVAMKWAGWIKSRGPRVPGRNFFNNFPVALKIRTSRYQTLECLIATLPT